MNDSIETLQTYIVDLSQDTPYLGNLREGESINASGYFVRNGNQTVYPSKNRSIVLRLCTRDGVVGWGETYGLVAPKATIEIIHDLLKGFVLGRDPTQVTAIHQELYNLMRVRGYTGGFYLDALAAIDIALWDIVGKLKGVPVAQLFGGAFHQSIPAYISGLPEDRLQQRCELALKWQERGFDSLKFALPVADEGAVVELGALRKILGEDHKIAIDMHWSHTARAAIHLGQQLKQQRPWFLEAPVAPEDIEGLAQVCRESGQTIAAGEEWRTIHDARLRIDRQALHIVQPEMGHTGITQFMAISQYAQAHHLDIIPHATIGSGIFLAASLQASAALPRVVSHEFQHSVFLSFQHYLNEALICEKGAYLLRNRPGLGVEPSDAMWSNMQEVD